MTGKEKFYRYLRGVFWISLIAVIAYTYYYMETAIPDKVSIVADEVEEFSFSLPFRTTLSSESEEVVLRGESNIPAGEVTISGNRPFSMYSTTRGSYQVGLKLFGLIKFKDIEVNVVDNRYAIPCGCPIGIYLKSDGVMVIGTGKVTDQSGMTVEPAFGILQSGDYIEGINGSPVTNKEDLIEAVNRIGASDAVVTIRRNDEEMDVKMNPVATNEGDYKLGAWVRDDTQGIGTLTYLDLNGGFGALGHGISDSDTGELVEITQGSLFSTQILGIEKGSLGKPGMMEGVIYYGPSSKLGEITANTEEGIFGTVSAAYRSKLEKQADAPIEIAARQEVKTGPALIRSNVSGEPKDYAIEIQKVDYNSSHKNKSLVLKVTDPTLLDLTGGIVQGMSGSPIIQNGKLVGAVTHVFIQDSTRGYGIFIENMLEH